MPAQVSRYPQILYGNMEGVYWSPANDLMIADVLGVYRVKFSSMPSYRAVSSYRYIPVTPMSDRYTSNSYRYRHRYY